LVNIALKETLVKNSELYCVKIAALEFLNKLAEHLIQTSEVEDEQKESENPDEDPELSRQSKPQEEFSESTSMKGFLAAVRQSGLISHMRKMLAKKDSPQLFIAACIQLLNRITIADHKNTLAIVTSLDFWTLLVDFVYHQNFYGKETRSLLTFGRLKELQIHCENNSN
jgi:hypothetical protein